MAQTTILEALNIWAKEKGVDASQLNDDTSDTIMALAGADLFGASNVALAKAPDETDFWGTTASQMQSGVTITGNAITGTLTKLTSGQLVTDWGEGYFLGIAFTKSNAKITSIKVGMNPSVSSGLVELDEDMLGVFKVTDKDTQRLEVLSSDGIVSFASFYDLSGLTLS